MKKIIAVLWIMFVLLSCTKQLPVKEITDVSFCHRTGQIVCDSINYDEIRNAPPIFPGMYTDTSFNPEFMVFVTGIVRPSNSSNIIYGILPTDGVVNIAGETRDKSKLIIYFK